MNPAILPTKPSSQT